ncbi:S1-like domain-containing RNA-binding protein [Helicobacter pametensis]|uniref:S1-like domain-containing RNA-binding protein n=1 Tax=Helicobacter pametensis TaxID=95149 RepID=UPI00047F4210|nr:S1-like domain-containing RNA-binding protein [Helicobacter pametensis]
MVGTKVCLKIEKILPFGCILGKEEILLPTKYAPKEVQVGMEVEVFVYTDSEDRIIATTLNPYGILGEIVCLEVVDISPYGVFLDLGIAKDILMPCKDAGRFKLGDRVAVQIQKDKEGRLLASQNLRFQKYRGREFVCLEAVAYRRSPLGFECIVEKKYQGMLFANEIFEPIELGKSYAVQVKKTRQDGKIDLKLAPKDEAKALLDLLHKNGGRLEIGKESEPQEVVRVCQMSKKALKRALVSLAQKVGQDERGIYLLDK